MDKGFGYCGAVQPTDEHSYGHLKGTPIDQTNVLDAIPASKSKVSGKAPEKVSAN